MTRGVAGNFSRSHSVRWVKAVADFQSVVGCSEGPLGICRDPKAETAEFRFYAPRIFVGIDAYNGGSKEATVTVHSPHIREVSFTIKPGELRRIRTGWRDRSSEVVFDLKDGAGLHFDNLAYRFQ